LIALSQSKTMKYILFILVGLILVSLFRKQYTLHRQNTQEYEINEASLQQYEKEQKTLDKQVERNLKGIELEKKGHTDKAIELYEQNVSESFDGNFPYDRLAIIYRKRKQIDDEIRVLKKAVWVFENVVHQARGDRLSKLDRFKKRLQKAHLNHSVFVSEK